MKEDYVVLNNIAVKRGSLRTDRTLVWVGAAQQFLWDVGRGFAERLRRRVYGRQAAVSDWNKR